MDKLKTKYIKLVADVGIRAANEALGTTRPQVTLWSCKDADFYLKLDEAKKEYHRKCSLENKRRARAIKKYALDATQPPSSEEQERLEMYKKATRVRINDLTETVSKLKQECADYKKQIEALRRQVLEQGNVSAKYKNMKEAYIGRTRDRCLYIFTSKPKRIPTGYSMTDMGAAISEYNPMLFGGVGVNDEGAKKILYTIIKDE